MRRQSNGKQPIGSVIAADALIGVSFVLALAWAAAVGWNGTAALVYPIVSTLILYLVFGWFSVSVLAYLSKIIPFLWWAFRFRSKEQKKGAVLLSDMVPQRRLTIELWIYAAGVGLLMAGNLLASSAVALTGSAIMAASAAIYMAELAKAFRY
ncbi:hypothetical protein SD70_06115 [Gordoniibacillus kamchatkensis]|uniref:Uncharacterized protein n=1 Tax=Gordoniibacillus kamchatkensis TaxID=1590651 RepID=A0ABR5AKW1_9BACL|nr:hypothetical protein SD70_06115 [Paenibacillus sp. VKM B-2647]